MDIIELLDQGYAWTAARIAPVSAADLDAPTPCGRWNLRDLLDHTIDTLGVFADAVAGPAGAPEAAARADGESSWVAAITELAARSRQGWSTPGALDRTYEMRFGTMPGPIAASANLLEVVVHGWDISQATGEVTDIPTALAEPILEFAQIAIGEAQRGEQFADDLGTGDTPSERLVAFLGRKPT
jgi:uncharacterized protein (TIGR03086 family)